MTMGHDRDQVGESGKEADGLLCRVGYASYGSEGVVYSAICLYW